jgi:hypothetical protein
MQGLKERQNAPQILNNSGESLNPISESCKPMHHGGCGCNRKGSMSAHSVFVLAKDGIPLTPMKPAKAKKLMKAGIAKPVWNKFSQFGIQMLVETRKETPKTAMGIDNGTKFEGYSVVCGNENSINTMWKLPDKKDIIRKLKIKRLLRKERRRRNCRRRACRHNNRDRKGFISPSQLVIVNSRLKAIKELLKTYPIRLAGIEDVRFKNHHKGNNYSTVEIGKNKIYDFLEKYVILHKFKGWQTQKLRKLYGYKKYHIDKSVEIFSTHCCDSLTIATALTKNNYIGIGKFIVVNDSYRPIRRRLHDMKPSKNGIRAKYSTGNFMSIRKGSICKFGLLGGGTKNYAYVCNWVSKRLRKPIQKIEWFSKEFFIKDIYV